MHPWRPALAALVMTALAACGDGGDEGDDGQPTFTISGTITAADGQVMDSDTADVLDVPKVRNDTPETAQAVAPTSVIGGFVGVATDPISRAIVLTDERDHYAVHLAAGQGAHLTISNPSADLELCLLSAAAPGTPVDCSIGTGATRAVTAPSDGDYLVVVDPVDSGSDASNYVLVMGVTAPAGAGELRASAEFVPGEILVRFRNDATAPAALPDAEALRVRAAGLGLEPLGGALRGRPALLALPVGAAARARALDRLGVARRIPGTPGAPLDGVAEAKLDTLRAVKALRGHPGVVSADPNYVLRPSASPPNEHYQYQWHYPLINLPRAWDAARGAGSIVAVVDTGIVAEHPDFDGGAQLVPGYDFIDDVAVARDGDRRDADPNDEGDEATLGQSSWHGTHVAGTVAGAWREGRGAVGVAPGAKVMPLRVLGAGGGTSADVNEALRFAAGLPNASGTLPARRADVINLSLGCLNCFSATDAAVYREVRAAGVVVVAAAGNENTTALGYPASYPGVISVSAVDLNLARAPYSNRNGEVDVAAPGGDTSANLNGDAYADGVLSAAANDSSGARVPEWRFYQGTSMASPHVAGVVALMKSVCPELTPEQLDAILASGAMTRDLGTRGRDDVFGHGLVDALAAVQAAQEECGEPIPAGVEATPVLLDFGFGTAETVLELTIAKTGEEPLTVTAASTTAQWLTVAPKPGATGPDGFGTYTVTAARDGLPDGRYAAEVQFARSDGGTAEVPATMQVGVATGPGDAGFLYVLLLNEARDRQLQGSGAGGGRYPFAFTGLPEGRYYLVAGTDSDNDDFICDEGEVCGAWPTMGLLTPIDVDANQPGRDFGVGLDLTLGALRAGEGATGFPKLPATKAVGGAR